MGIMTDGAAAFLGTPTDLSTKESQQTPLRSEPSREAVKSFEEAMKKDSHSEPNINNRTMDADNRSQTTRKNEEKESLSSLFEKSFEGAKVANKPEKDGSSTKSGLHDLESGGLFRDAGSTSQTGAGTLPQAGLEQLFSGLSPAAMDAPGVANTGQVDGMRLPSEALEKLVDRVLVSTPENGINEVRITLSDSSVLRGTNIQIARDLNGMLTVTLIADNSQAFQTLVASRADLTKMLESTEKQGVIVNLQTAEDGDNANDTDKRSRGLETLEDSVYANR